MRTFSIDQLVKDKPTLAPSLDDEILDIRRLVGNGIRTSEYSEYISNSVINVLLTRVDWVVAT